MNRVSGIASARIPSTIPEWLGIANCSLSLGFIAASVTLVSVVLNSTPKTPNSKNVHTPSVFIAVSGPGELHRADPFGQ
jgi:hypothetical protein